MFDVAIIGAGAVGAFVARDLSRYRINVVLIDKELEVSEGTTKANSAIIHAGYDCVPGTLKAKLNVQGNKMFDRICDELDVPFKRIGSLVIALSKEQLDIINELYERGRANGVPGLEVIGRERLKELEPNVNEDATGALYAKTAGIISPYELALACAENAVTNGVTLKLDTEVKDIEIKKGGFIIKTSREDIETRYIVNATGLFADVINRMLKGDEFSINPRRGEYCLFDKNDGHLVNHVLFQVPTPRGKGVLVTPTVHGNLLIGPNSVNVDIKEDVSTTGNGLEYIVNCARKTMNKFSMRDVITSFAGLRASTSGGDFIINVPVQGAVNAAAIDSPGLSSSPAISEMVVQMLKEQGLKLIEKDYYNPVRKRQIRFADMSDSEREKAIEKNPLYGRVICRCETVTEGEIVDAIKRPAGARTVDGVKRRLRAGMGRCQGGFCMPKVVEILSRELGIPYMDIVKDKKGGYLFTGRIKDNYTKGDGDANA
ncbi:MAG TPA: FAD/NAD(P)-binding oxidoreductase [Clostridiaceae bacterium]|nr:FAD/NAD(P)-binding oxidoreductase [Clostridiaceae bacterium]